MTRREAELSAEGVRAAHAMRSDCPVEMARDAAHRLWEAARRVARTTSESASVGEVCDLFVAAMRGYYATGGEAGSCAVAARYFKDVHGKRPIGELVHTDMLVVLRLRLETRAVAGRAAPAPVPLAYPAHAMRPRELRRPHRVLQLDKVGLPELRHARVPPLHRRRQERRRLPQRRLYLVVRRPFRERSLYLHRYLRPVPVQRHPARVHTLRPAPPAPPRPHGAAFRRQSADVPEAAEGHLRNRGKSDNICGADVRKGGCQQH